MPLPPDITTLTLIGAYRDGTGRAYRGTVTITPSGPVSDATDQIVIAPIPIECILDVDGAFSIVLPATDAALLNPTGWTYTVQENLAVTVGGDTAYSRSYPVSLPSALAPGPVDITSLAPVVSIPTAPDGVAISGTPSVGQVPTATSGTTATWQTPSGGGGGGGTPSGTVVSETAYGQSATAGTASAYSRGDHTHGSPALSSSTPAASAVGDAGAVGTASTPARSDHVHAREAFGGAPATTEGIGQAAAAGTASTPARSDHVHPLAAAGAPGSSAVGDTTSTGTASTFSASDHRHARESFGTVTAQMSFGGFAANGAATTPARSDHAHGTPSLPSASTSTAGVVQLDGTATDIQPLGVRAAGSTGMAADAGHVHAMPLLSQLGGVAISGTPSSGQVPTATSGTTATWQTPSGGGGTAYTGPWDSGTAYSAGQLVTRGGALLGATASSTGADPLPTTAFLSGTPGTVDAADAATYEMGVAFTVATPVRLTAASFYKAALNLGAHLARLWEQGVSGTWHKQVESEFTGETSSGTQTVPIAYDLLPGRSYILAVAMPQGHYSLDSGFYASPVTVGSLTISESIFGNSAGAVPTTTSTNNYWVWPSWAEGSADWDLLAWTAPLPPYLT